MEIPNGSRQRAPAWLRATANRMVVEQADPLRRRLSSGRGLKYPTVAQAQLPPLVELRRGQTLLCPGNGG